MTEYHNQTFQTLSLEKTEVFDCRFQNCLFSHCSFQEVQLQNCLFQDCKFEACRLLHNQFSYTVCMQNTFSDCMLLGINWAMLERSDHIFLPFSSFHSCVLKYNVFFGFSLKKFSFQSNVLQNCSFEECNLEDAIFHGCDLKETSFQKNNLSHADFRDAQQYCISIENNTLKKARFSFPEVIQLLNSLEISIE